MSNQTDSAYFAERATEELELSRAAYDPRVAAVHVEMAMRFAIFSKDFDTEAPRLQLVVSELPNLHR